MPDGASKVFLSRRRFCKTTAAMVAGAVMTGAGQAMAAKKSKQEARYRNRPNGNERCFVCKHYFVGHCEIVEGRVGAHGWCRFFEPSASAAYRAPFKEDEMAKCDVCGNDYDKAFQVVQGDRRMTFDSFECAIEAMAPRCAHCNCRVIGHGVEAQGQIYCCAHCAKQKGAAGIKDRAA